MTLQPTKTRARIAAMARQAKPRPQCRRVILARGYQPIWHTGTLRGRLPDGRIAHLSPGLRKEMARMIVEGLLPEPAS